MGKKMSLGIDVALSGSQARDGTWNVTPTYSQGNSDPASPGVVDEHGNIDLTKMAKTRDYDNAISVAFTITGNSVTNNRGNPTSVRFPADASSALTITPASPNVFHDFSETGDGSCVSFTDEDKDAATYDYCLTMVFSSGGGSGSIVPLDPRIVNRPDSN